MSDLIYSCSNTRQKQLSERAKQNTTTQVNTSRVLLAVALGDRADK